MRNLTDAISRRVLPSVRRPGQYVGLETNARHKDVEAAQVSLVLAFPDAYALGISHLGGQLLYHLANDTPGVACDRTYCPMPDAEAVMRREGVPLFGWESRRAVADFDIVGFSLPHEGCLTNVLTMLDLAGIPLHAAERGQGCPIVIAGDAGSDAPEPMADFIDLFCVGEGELTLPAVIELVRLAKAAGASREETILQAARTIPGVYAPRYYRPEYNADGTLSGIEPLHEDLPRRIVRRHVRDLSEALPLTVPLVPLAEAVHDRVVIEIMRGCPNMCRFCQAGHVRLPVRCRRVEEIMAAAEKAIAATGYHEISLLSLSTSDYPHFAELIERLNKEYVPRHISVSLPSLRVDAQLEAIPRLTSQVRKHGLTIAAEAGSERLRRAIRKDITDDAMANGVRAAYQAGWRSVKVYFMAGLPGEGPEDIASIFRLCRRLSQTRRDVDGQSGAINAAVSWLVPRPHTPMQFAAMRDEEYFWSVRNQLRDLSRRTAIAFKFHRLERSILEGVIARGDRRVGAAIEHAWRAGARFDAWDEHWNWQLWQDAFAATGISIAFYAQRQRPISEFLPWDHIDTGRPRTLLETGFERMMAELE